MIASSVLAGQLALPDGSEQCASLAIRAFSRRDQLNTPAALRTDAVADASAPGLVVSRLEMQDSGHSDGR